MFVALEVVLIKPSKHQTHTGYGQSQITHSPTLNEPEITQLSPLISPTPIVQHISYHILMPFINTFTSLWNIIHTFMYLMPKKKYVWP